MDGEIEAGASGATKPRLPDWCRGALLIAPSLLLYLLGLNPWLVPGPYDNVTYLVAAQELGESGTVTFQGLPITRWPPGFPLALSLLALGGLLSVTTAKLLVMACASTSLLLAWRLLEAEGCRHAWWGCLLFSLCPMSLYLGTTVMSEWPFLLTAFGFLHLLRRMEGQPSVGLILAAGALLGAAALTRWVGVLLGAAVLWQCVRVWSVRTGSRWWWRLGPEVLVALIGAAMVLGWRFHLLSTAAGTPLSEAAASVNPTDHPLHAASPIRIRVAWSLSDLLIKGQALARAIGPDGLARFLYLSPLLLTLAGLVAEVRRRGWTPAQAFAVVYVVALGLAAWPITRLAFVIGPFLFTWTVAGGAILLGPLLRQDRRWLRALPALALAAWLGLLLAMDGQRLFVGDALDPAHARMGGLSRLASRTEGDFYRGDWRVLREASRVMELDACPGGVLVGGAGYRYVHAWTGRATDSRQDGPWRYRLDIPGEPAPVREGSWTEVWRSGEFALSRRVDGCGAE